MHEIHYRRSAHMPQQQLHEFLFRFQEFECLQTRVLIRVPILKNHKCHCIARYESTSDTKILPPKYNGAHKGIVIVTISKFFQTRFLQNLSKTISKFFFNTKFHKNLYDASQVLMWLSWIVCTIRVVSTARRDHWTPLLIEVPVRSFC